MNKEFIYNHNASSAALDEINEPFKRGDLVLLAWAIPEWNEKPSSLDLCIYLGAKKTHHLTISLYTLQGFLNFVLRPSMKMIKLN